MEKTYLKAAGTPNLQPASSCRRSEAGLQTNSLVMRAVHAFWPTKTMLELKEATGASDRMIQYWIANKYSLSAADLAGLLRTEAGFAVLENIMGSAKPTWWKRFKKSVALSMLRAEQAMQRKRLEQMELEFDE